MTGILFTLILIFVIAGAGYWAVSRIGEAFGLPAPLIVVAQVVIVLVALWLLLERTGLAARLSG